MLRITSLRHKLMIVTIALLGVYGFVIALLSGRLILGGYLSLENADSDKEMQRIQLILKREGDFLGTFTVDWARQDKGGMGYRIRHGDGRAPSFRFVRPCGSRDRHHPHIGFSQGRKGHSIGLFLSDTALIGKGSHRGIPGIRVASRRILSAGARPARSADSSPYRSRFEGKLLDGLQKEGSYYHSDDHDRRLNYAVNDDVYGQPLFAIRLTYPRVIYRQGVGLIRLSLDRKSAFAGYSLRDYKPGDRLPYS